MAASTAMALTITEIHYHPSALEGDAEFIEIYHEGSVPLDLGGFAFTNGIRYVFPRGTIAAPRSYIVVAQSPDLVQARYGVDAFGPFDGRLDNDGDRIVLVREGGGEVAALRYGDRDDWPGAADGFGHSLSLRAPHLDPRQGASWSPSPFMGGTPGRSNGFSADALEQILVDSGAVWRFHKGVSAPPVDWREPAFDDDDWETGPSGFGYDDGDDATVLSDMQGSYIAVFIRVEFTLPSPVPDGLILRIRFDDGFAAWIDGQPATRAGLGADPIAFNAPASTAHEALGFEDFDVSHVLQGLSPGRHVLAVEGHNVNVSSSDFSLEPRLIARTVIQPGGGAANLVINEIKPHELGAPEPDDSWIELYNRGDESVDLGGVMIAARPEDGQAAVEGFVFDPGTALLPGAFVAVHADDLPFPLAYDGSHPSGESGFCIINAAGDRVLDACAFTDDDLRVSLGRYPDGADGWFSIDEPTGGEPNIVRLWTDIVINEIMYHPLGDYDPFDPAAERPAEREYVELYNRGTVPMDLAGWRFSRGIYFDFPQGTALRAGEYLVVAKNPQRISGIYGLDGVFGPYEGELADGGERVRLEDNNGNLVDEVAYRDGGEWDEWADGGGSSLELMDPRSDNRFASAWRASDESTRAPWTHVTYSSPRTGTESEIQLWLLGKGTVLVDDLHVHASGIDYYRDDFESGPGHWAFRGTHQDSVLTMEDARSGGTSLRIEASGRGEQRWNYVETDTTRTIAAGRTYTVSYWGRWIRGMPTLLSRQHGHGLARTVRLEVPQDLGTPGMRNSRFLLNAGPAVDGLAQAPVMPLASEQVVVQVRVSDPDGIASVNLLYRDQRDGAFQTLALFDDGGHGDADAADGIYGGSIPAFEAGTRVQFQIEAVDGGGAETTYPRMGPCLYRVTDGRSETDVARFHLITTDETDQWLAGRSTMSNHLLPASFVLGNQAIYHNVGFRYRGSPYIRPQQPSGRRIRFPSDQPFRGRITHMNLDSQRQDGTRQHERAVLYMMRKIGVTHPETSMPYSLSDYATLWRNGSRVSLYEMVERVDDEYTDAWWGGEEGCLLKMNVQTEFRDNGTFDLVELADLVYRGEDEESYRLLYNLFSHEERDDLTPLIDLCRSINAHSGEALEAVAQERIFMRQWADELAVRLFVADWDTFGVANGHNVYLYLPPRTGRWEVIPWDADLTFGNVNGQITLGTNFPALRKLFNRPVFDRMFRSSYGRIIDDVLVSGEVDDELDRVYDVIRTEGAGSPGAMKSFLAQRASMVPSMIPREAFRITTNNGEDFEAEETTVKIRGVAPITVDSVTLNDVPFDDEDPPGTFRWLSYQVWEAEVELTRPVTPLIFRGYDPWGEFAGLDAVAVTAPPLPLTVTGVTPERGSAAGGTPVTISGTGFAPGNFVLFMGSIAQDVVVVSSTQITAVTPPSPIGPMLADVGVMDGDGLTVVLPGAFAYVEGAAFIRGNANRDERIDLADAIAILAYLFTDGELTCMDAADVNDDGKLDLSDPIALLGYQFGEDPQAPPPPFDAPGEDPTADELSCGAP